MKDKKEVGGADRVRTDDLHNAIVALFQLSYGPVFSVLREGFKNRRDKTSQLINLHLAFFAGEAGSILGPWFWVSSTLGTKWA